MQDTDMCICVTADEYCKAIREVRVRIDPDSPRHPNREGEVFGASVKHGAILCHLELDDGTIVLDMAAERLWRIGPMELPAPGMGDW